MHTHSEEKFLPYTPDAVFDLVADVENYPEFLPWCVATRVTERNETEMIAEMAVGYKGVREQYTSRVDLNRGAGTIDVTAIKGPFKSLVNNWRFEPADGGCTVHFHIEFEFGSWLLEAVVSAFFNEAVRQMVGAFEKRAHALYANS